MKSSQLNHYRTHRSPTKKTLQLPCSCPVSPSVRPSQLGLAAPRRPVEQAPLGPPQVHPGEGLRVPQGPFDGALQLHLHLLQAAHFRPGDLPHVHAAQAALEAGGRHGVEAGVQQGLGDLEKCGTRIKNSLMNYHVNIC